MKKKRRGRNEAIQESKTNCKNEGWKNEKKRREREKERELTMEQFSDWEREKTRTTFIWILPFCSIPMALHFSVSVKRCMAALEDRNSISVGLRISWGLKQNICEHCSHYILRCWQLAPVTPVIETL